MTRMMSPSSTSPTHQPIIISNSTNNPADLLEELIEWNDVGIDAMLVASSYTTARIPSLIVSSDEEEDDDEEERTMISEMISQGLVDGISSFRQAFEIAKQLLATIAAAHSRDDGASGTSSTSTASTATTTSSFSLGLGDELLLHVPPSSSSSSTREHPTKKTKTGATSSTPTESSTLEYTFTRPFTIASIPHEEEEEDDENDNVAMTTSTTTSSSLVLPTAVVVFNLAMVHHVLGITAASSATATSARSGASTTGDQQHQHHAELLVLRLQQCTHLYGCCMKLVMAELDHINDAEADDDTKVFLDMLALATLNNLSLAYREMADYDRSYQIASKLKEMLIETEDTMVSFLEEHAHEQHEQGQEETDDDELMEDDYAISMAIDDGSEEHQTAEESSRSTSAAVARERNKEAWRKRSKDPLK